MTPVVMTSCGFPCVSLPPFVLSVVSEDVCYFLFYFLRYFFFLHKIFFFRCSRTRRTTHVRMSFARRALTSSLSLSL